MSIVRLTPTELGLLNKHAFAILCWLRENEAEAGDCFIGSALDVDDDEVHKTLKRVLVVQNKNGGLSKDQLDELLHQAAPPVWARSVHTLFTSSTPRIVPDGATQTMASALDAAGGAEASLARVQKAVELGLNQLTLENKAALGELCSIIKETSMDAECTAMSMAPTIMVSPDADSALRAQAKTVMVVLVAHSKELFAMNEAARLRGASVASARPRNQSVALSAVDKARRAALREFYEWRDPPNVGLEDGLFDNYEFVQVAKGVMHKYGVLPAPFAEELDDMVKDGAAGLEWYDKSKVAKTKRFSMLPMINRNPFAKPAAYKPTQVDRIIDEIVATEVSYHDTMRDLLEKYVNTVRDIADGKRGNEARTQLGLDARTVEDVFGPRLQNVLSVSNGLLAKLDLVSLVSTPPKSDIGRPGLVAQIMSDHAPELRVYAPYISSHMTAVKALKVALARVEKAEKLKASSSARKLLGDKKRETRDTFSNLWFQLSSESKHLRGHTLESILIMPVQRVPRYKLLLETLRKEVPKLDPNHAAMPIIDEAYESVMTAALQINTAVRQHMKLESFFGKDEMISPNNSIVRKDAEGNFQAIVNSYVG